MFGIDQTKVSEHVRESFSKIKPQEEEKRKSTHRSNNETTNNNEYYTKQASGINSLVTKVDKIGTQAPVIGRHKEEKKEEESAKNIGETVQPD
jgi:hypothetical protein